MADYWVDSAKPTGNNGSTPDLAFKYLRTTLSTFGLLQPGDRVWVRRTLNENQTTNGTIVQGQGRLNAPIQIIGWPRASRSGTANFANGSTTVDNLSFTVTRGTTLARWLTCPEGNRYMIAHIAGSTSITLDRPYAGASATGASFVIASDDEYSDRPSIGEVWDADTLEMPQIRGGGIGYPSIIVGSERGFWWFKNLNYYKDTNGGMVTHECSQEIPNNGTISYRGCIFTWPSSFSGSGAALYVNGAVDMIHLERCAIGGIAGTANTCVGINSQKPKQRFSLRDVVINSTNIGFYAVEQVPLSLENVNIGVEVANNYANIRLNGYGSLIVGKNVWLGQSTEAYKFRQESGVNPQLVAFTPFVNINIEGWEKKLDQIYRNTGQLITSKTVAAESTDPLKRSGGNDIVLIADLGTGGQYWGPHPEQLPVSVFDQRIWAGALTAKTYRVYLQSTTAIASGKVWLEAEYIEKKSSNAAWAERRKLATAAVAQRSGSNDWSQYVEVTGVTPHVDSPVRLRLFVSYYASGQSLYIDPKVVIIEE